MRTILATILVVLVSIFAYFLFFSETVRMEVFNRTPYNLDSVKICNKTYKIEKNKSIIMNDCKSFEMQGGLPFRLPDAFIKNKQKDTTKLLFCGTGIEEIKKGNYKFDVVISEKNNYYTLYWQIHKD